jgi:hypothetical protein
MNLGDDENKQDEVFHDATWNGYTSDAAGGRAAEKSMASANAEVPETKAAEEEAAWTRVGGEKHKPGPVNAPTETKYLWGNWQILCECDDDVTKALESIGASQKKPMEERKWGWRPVFYMDGYRSYRTERVKVEATEFVLACADAADGRSWIMESMKENRKHTRINFQVPGRSPSHWQAPKRTGVPASPAPTVPRPAFPTDRNRREWAQKAWAEQFPPMEKKPPQEEPRLMAARLDEVEKLLKQLLAQGQPSAPAAAPPATQDPELVQRIQDLEADKATMAEQLAEVRKLVEQQERVAATQLARYNRSNKILVEARMEDAETMTEQQQEIAALKKRLQQQEEKPMFTVVTELVHETTPEADISEATQQVKVTQYDPGAFHTPSPQEKKERREQEVQRAIQSLGRSPREQGKNIRNKKSRQRQRDAVSRVQRAEAATGVGPVASLFQSDAEEDRVPAQPVEYPGGGEAGPASNKRMSDREPGLGGTPEAKEVRVVYSDTGWQHWQPPQRAENPYRPDPNSEKSDSDCDLENSD